MVLTASSETRAVADRACSARVFTAVATALLASGVFGLNSLLMSDSNSESSAVVPPAWVCEAASGITRDPFLGLLSGLGRFGRCGNSLQQRGVAQQFCDQVLRSSFAVHVSQQIGQ